MLNGQEIGGGSIRIHSRALQQRVFEILGIDEAAARAKFGFLLEALEYGAPPMGGIAFGLDRIVAILAGVDVHPGRHRVPKTRRARCPLTDAPTPVSPLQLRELALEVALTHPRPRRARAGLPASSHEACAGTGKLTLPGACDTGRLVREAESAPRG